MRDMQGPEMKFGEEATSMEKLWAKAAKAFEEICHESLQRGEITGFDQLREKIEDSSKVLDGLDEEQKGKWEKAKNVGLESLRYLRMLIGAASQASTLLPIPESAATITCSALCFVFNIPEAIRGYEDAVNDVFTEVSSAMAQFRIYTSMEHVDAELIRQIHRVMISFVKICAHVVKYRQGRKRDRFLQRFKSIFEDDSGLSDEMDEFKRALQQQRDIEGTVTLSVVVETQKDVLILREQFVVFGKMSEETNQAVMETQKGVQALREDADRMKTLIKIRDTLGVPSTVRLDTITTQTCINIHDKCLFGTGTWIWTHDAYTCWTAPLGKDSNDNKDGGVKTSAPHVLILSGPPSSGKTSASALITKRLEEQKGRTYVAHYFFPANARKSDDDHSVPSAVKYMAFQIARVDATVQKTLGKACDAGSGFFRRLSSPDTLDALWGELKVGASGSGAVYYLVFDGLENLPPKQVDLLLNFVFGEKLTESDGRVRVLLGGSEEQFDSRGAMIESKEPLRIRMQDHNGPDMRLVIEDALAKRGMLQHPKPGSDQEKARNDILEKLPQNVGGSYSRLQFGLDDVVRLLSTRTAFRELDRILDQSASSHETAIQNLQRSLTGDEVSELNELLKWVLFNSETLTIEQLEAAMFLYSGTESLVPLQYIIENKYSAVLKLENGYVYSKDGVQEYLEKKKSLSKSSHSGGDRPTISMTITIHNVDQEICRNFLWDLSHKAIRDNFRFDFNSSSSGALHGGSQAVITADEVDAHRTIVTRALAYLLDGEPKDQVKAIGEYLVCWLPHHLGRLHDLEVEDDDHNNATLTAREQAEIGLNLYRLFKDDTVFLRHKEIFEGTYWTKSEIETVQQWLRDSAVVRRVDKAWRKEVQDAISPTRGYLKELVKFILRGFLRERSWGVDRAFMWIEEFIQLEDEKFRQPVKSPRSNGIEQTSNSDPDVASVSTASTEEITSDRLSKWCQDFLEMDDSELDSLWYERLAEFNLGQGPERYSNAVSLYQQALGKDNPSWVCHRGLAIVHAEQGETEKAITEGELALQQAQLEDATPKAGSGEIHELQIMLGSYNLEAGNLKRAEELYLAASKSERSEQASRAKLGHLKVKAQWPDAEEARRYLRNVWSSHDDDDKHPLVDLFKLIASDSGAESLMLRILTVVKSDPDLLRAVLRAMELATAKRGEDRADTQESIEPGNFIEDTARGVLLFFRGMAAYRFGIVLDGSEARVEAARLWNECLEVISSIGGRNAFMARREALAWLAKYYFDSMVEGGHSDHVDELAKLGETNHNAFYGDAVGFLGALYTMRGKKEKSQAVLKARIERGLQILWDDDPQNDIVGYGTIFKSLLHFQDFNGAAIPLSLRGQPDLVSSVMEFEEKDMPVVGGAAISTLLDTTKRLAKETISLVRDKFPHTSQQSQRISAAKAHLEALLETLTARKVQQSDSTAGQVGVGPPDKDAPGNAANSQVLQDGDSANEMAMSESEIMSQALGLLLGRINPISLLHTPQVNKDALMASWTCDGRARDGSRCMNKADFDNDFYHCIFCLDCDFCRGCLERLRSPPDSETDRPEILACSPRHKWLKLPRHGDPIFSGSTATRVRKSKMEWGPEEGILEMTFLDNGEEIEVESWKAELAKEWDIVKS